MAKEPVKVAWTTPQMEGSLQKIVEEAKELRGSRAIKTEGETAICILVQRLAETLLTGQPQTHYPPRHHE
jgi:hypothetical protein